MGPDDIASRIVEHIDANHPRLGSWLMQFRWGGLRTIEPNNLTWTAVVSTGVLSGLGLRHAAGRHPDGRHRVHLGLAAPTMSVVTLAALWRWDAARWRRTHITIRVDLPPEALRRLLSDLAQAGIHVEQWHGHRAADGVARGLSCELRDLRRVNAVIERGSSGSAS